MLKIDCILAQFSFDCFSPEARLRPLKVGQAASPDADLLLVESTGNSYGGGWCLGTQQHRTAMEALIRECRRRGIPTVFWAKEDPVQFERFKWITPMFDFVFTTDADCVGRHREWLGHDRVAVLPFAAQPNLHYADPAVSRASVPCFAGVYYDNMLPERRREVEYVLKPAIPFGLHLYDRGLSGNFYLTKRTFPAAFDAVLRPAVPYEDMGRIYRSYRVFLNVGCVQRSPTMFSRRVFEVLASGTPLVSAYSVGIERLLGNVVHLSRSATETRLFLRSLLSDAEFWSVSSLKGQRAVLREHTYAHRLRDLLRRCGVAVPEYTSSRTRLFEQAALATDQETITRALKKPPDAPPVVRP